MAARQPQFSPKQVAQAMEVSESSVKRWCDSGTIPMIKTLGGHRRITLDSLQKFVLTSKKKLLRPEVLGLPNLSPSRSMHIGGSDLPASKRFREALASGDEERCRDIVQSMIEKGATRSEAAEILITDAMHGLGQAWECRELDVYQERRGCDIAMRLIYELRASLPAPDANAPVAIGGSPQGGSLPTADRIGRAFAA